MSDETVSHDIEKRGKDAFDGMFRDIAGYAAKEMEERYRKIVEGVRIDARSEPMQIGIWFDDDWLKPPMDLEPIVLGWLDVPKDEQTASKEQIEGWIAGLEGLASKLRTAVAEGRYADPEEA